MTEPGSSAVSCERYEDDSRSIPSLQREEVYQSAYERYGRDSCLNIHDPAPPDDHGHISLKTDDDVETKETRQSSKEMQLLPSLFTLVFVCTVLGWLLFATSYTSNSRLAHRVKELEHELQQRRTTVVLVTSVETANLDGDDMKSFIQQCNENTPEDVHVRMWRSSDGNDLPAVDLSSENPASIENAIHAIHRLIPNVNEVEASTKSPGLSRVGSYEVSTRAYSSDFDDEMSTMELKFDHSDDVEQLKARDDLDDALPSHGHVGGNEDVSTRASTPAIMGEEYFNLSDEQLVSPSTRRSYRSSYHGPLYGP